MGMFSNATTEGLEQTEDRLGGFTPFDTDAYEAEIKMAFAGKSAGGANNVTLVADIGGREYRETIYWTNRNGENFYLNKNDQTKKVPLPGFTTINDICLVTTEKPLSEQETEDKVVKLWNSETKQEEPQSVPMLMALLGQKVTLGIVRETVNVNEKVGNDYVPTAKTRDQNFIDKVFHNPSNVTVVEARQAVANGTEPTSVFYTAWVDKNRGKTRDNTAKSVGGNAGRPAGGPPASGSGAAPKSLFNKG